jgi:hypothetical protein
MALVSERSVAKNLAEFADARMMLLVLADHGSYH